MAQSITPDNTAADHGHPLPYRTRTAAELWRDYLAQKERTSTSGQPINLYQIMLGKKVIIRADRAGVFFGTLVRKEGSEVELKDCRRIWYWSGAASLSELALSGVTRPGNCKFTVTVPSITILGVIEVIPCTDEAIKNIESVPVWKMR